MPKEKIDQVCRIRLLFFLISFRRLAYNLLEVHGFHGLNRMLLAFSIKCSLWLGQYAAYFKQFVQ